jgi:hypothetical protein
MPKTPAEIVKAAYEYMATVMAVQMGKISNARVEELTSSINAANEKIWNVVISYDILGDFVFEKTREYKQFSVNDEGEVLDMKIKTL